MESVPLIKNAMMHTSVTTALQFSRRINSIFLFLFFVNSSINTRTNEKFNEETKRRRERIVFPYDFTKMMKNKTHTNRRKDTLCDTTITLFWPETKLWPDSNQIAFRLLFFCRRRRRLSLICAAISTSKIQNDPGRSKQRKQKQKKTKTNKIIFRVRLKFD